VLDTAQSVSFAHVVRHAVALVLQLRPLAHWEGSPPPLHCPVPLHVFGAVSVLPPQVVGTHWVPDGYHWQPLFPSQSPS
jgi:hypothetical protein